MEERKREVGKAFVEQVQRDHQVWSLGDEYDELDNKRKRGKICLLARKGSNSEDG